jgi:iron-sulfur cluster repair protein YtfE (RIC family)
VKRSDALKALSRQHHQGLVVAMRLKRATTDTALEAREAFLEFWTSEGRDHFRAEEEVLLPAFARHAPPDHEAVVRVLVEHVDLRRRSAQLAEDGDPTPEELRELGERLEGHIRHEERVLFRLIEEALPEGELEHLVVALEEAEARGCARRCDQGVQRPLPLDTLSGPPT